MKSNVIALSLIWAVSLTWADTRTVKMLPGEQWWGLDNAFGRDMPFTVATKFSCDLRKSNYSHQALSLLVSDKGRVIWCCEPVSAEISGGEIALTSDKGEVVLREGVGKTLAEAFRYASRTWFRPTGEEPELLYFSAPQYNTWIELTYHQNEKDILAYAKSMLDHGLPPGVFMIDDTWQAAYGTWEFDATRFSDPKGLVDKLHGMGYRVLLWMCPFVSMDTPAFRRIHWGRNPDDARGWPTRGGFLTSSRKKAWGGVPPAAPINWWNGVSALLDLTHPNAIAWFGEQLERLTKDYGVDGFKFDGGGVEYYAGARSEEGAANKTYAYDHAATPVAQSACYGDFALKYKGSEYRNGFGFAGKPVIMRLHDKPHTWEALQRIIPDMLAAGFVGCPFICPDMVGGGAWSDFMPGAPFSQELFIRSAQVQALAPMMQISASPWRLLDARHQQVFKDTVSLRQRFAPRFVALAKQAARDGEPIMRNLEYAYPGRGYGGIRDEFLMGDDLLVAPVVEKGATSREVTIPPGTWMADDGATVTGPVKIVVQASLERLPYFLKANSPTVARPNVFMNADLTKTDGLGLATGWEPYGWAGAKLFAKAGENGVITLTAENERTGYFPQAPVGLKSGGRYRFSAEVRSALPKGAKFGFICWPTEWNCDVKVWFPENTQGQWCKVEKDIVAPASHSPDKYSIGFVGAGFSVIPAILADNYGMTNISKIHGAVLSAWGFAGLAGNQAAILVSDKLGFGYVGVVTMLVVFYSLNLLNVVTLRRAVLRK